MDYASLRKKNSGSLAVIIALVACVLLSATMLFSRLISYSPADQTQRIPLTKSNGVTHVTTRPRAGLIPPTGIVLAADGGLAGLVVVRNGEDLHIRLAGPHGVFVAGLVAGVCQHHRRGQHSAGGGDQTCPGPGGHMGDTVGLGQRDPLGLIGGAVGDQSAEQHRS